MKEAESKFIIDHIHEQLEILGGDGADGDLNFTYDSAVDGKTVEVNWWDDEGEKIIRTETYRIDVKLIAIPKENRQ